MRSQSTLAACLAGTVLLSLATPATAQFQPGDVYREHVWRPTAPDTFGRATGSDATAKGSEVFLPNPVHSVTIPDLADAVRCEVMIEKLSSHAGTRLPKMRVNQNAWISIPEPAYGVIPGNRGQRGKTSEYLQMTYPVIPVPLAQIRVGTNTFQFDCQGTGGSAIGKTWPQWLHYGVVFRIYYKKTKTGAPVGEIRSPRSGDLVGDNPDFDVNATPGSGDSIARVDLLGDYDDFDWDGDGIDGGWHGHYRYGDLQRHMGSDFTAPFRPRWQNEWVPTQSEPFQVIARIVGKNGLVRISQPIRIGLLRSKTVHRYKSTNISIHWQTNRAKTHGNDVFVTGDLAKAKQAQLTVATWNAVSLENVKLNGSILLGRFGRRYDLSYDRLTVDPRRLQAGKNRIETFARTPNHGCEVQWPGFELFVRYDIPETPALFVPYGISCKGTNGFPKLTNAGTPKLTQRYTASLSNGKANSAAIVLNGFSKDSWSGFGLPFDWTALGATGCHLQTSIEFTLGLATDGTGRASQDFIVPNRTEFLGGSLFAQFAVLDPAANTLGLTLSDAGRWVFGR